MGAWSWVSNITSSVTSTVSSAYTTIKNVAAKVTSIPAVGDYLSSFGSQFWEGFTRVMDPSNVTKIVTTTKTRSTMAESVKANVVYYLGLSVLLEVSKNMILSVVTTEDENSWTNYSMSLTMNMLVMLSMSTIMAHRFYDNTLLNMTLAKQANEELPPSDEYHICECDPGTQIKSGLMSPVILSSKLLSIWAASYLPVIRYATPFAYTYAYGESLAEYPYTAAGVCTEHRAQKLAKENGYVFGLGASLYFVGETISYLLSSYTGANSVFISNAIYASIYPYFVTSALLREKPVPDNKHSVDFYYYHRYLSEHIVTSVGGQILPLLQNPKNKIDWSELFKKVVNAPPARLARHAMSYDLYGNWHSPHDFVLSPVNKLFFDEFYDGIIKEINHIIELRDKPLYQRQLKEIPIGIFAPIVPALPNRITRFVMSDAYKKLIQIIFASWLEDPLNATKRFFENIRKIQIAANVTIIPDHDPLWNEVMTRNAGGRTGPIIEEIEDEPNLPVVVVPDKKEDVPGPRAAQTFSLFVPGNRSEADKRKLYFLLDLKNNVQEPGWNKMGSSLFGPCVPHHINDLRPILKPLHASSSKPVVDSVFEEVKKTFQGYNPGADRDPLLKKLYPQIIDSIAIINKGSEESLPQLQRLTK